MQNGLSWYIMIHQGGKRLVYGRNKKQRKSGRAGLRRGLCRLFIGRLGGNDALVLSSGIYGEGLCSGHAPQIRAGPRRKLLFFLRAAGGSALTSQFSSYEQYRKYGLGIAALCGRELVAGASSYTVYDGGIEIQIDTQLKHRRKGLAAACGAKLILECLERGLYPSWDAHDRRSAALAEKLGYHVSHSYIAYCVSVPKAPAQP